MGTEMLRGVYPERSEWAQHDRGDLMTVWCQPAACHPSLLVILSEAKDLRREGHTDASLRSA
jgi:hypothetical protein